jgi:glycosyltransferase involved in cell wall biosynthesis
MVNYSLTENKLKVQSVSIGEFKPRFSIVIPAFNEEARIEGTLRKWIGFLDCFYTGEYEILVIIDGCTDNTVDIVCKFANERVVPLVYSERLGKGGALIEAFRYSKGDVIFFTDADGSLSVDGFVSFMNAIKFGNLVIGCRYFRGSDFVANLPLCRWVSSRVFNGLVQLLFPKLRGIYDTQCGAKAVRKDVISRVGDDLFITDFAFDINLIYSALRFGFVVKEISVDYDHVEDESKVSRSLFKVCFGMFLSIVRLRLYYSKLRKLIFSDGVLRRFVDFLVKVVS